MNSGFFESGARAGGLTLPTFSPAFWLGLGGNTINPTLSPTFGPGGGGGTGGGTSAGGGGAAGAGGGSKVFASLGSLAGAEGAAVSTGAISAGTGAVA